MLSDRSHYLPPLLILINLIDLREGFVDIGESCYKRGALFDGATYRFPIERVSPAVVLIARTAGRIENLEKMNRPFVIFLLPKGLRQESKPHGVMGVRDGKALRFPEESACRGHKCLAKYHWRDRHNSQERLSVIQRLGASPQSARKETLIIVGRLAVAIEPLDKPGDGSLNFLCSRFSHLIELICPTVHERGKTWKLSIRLNLSIDCSIVFSFSICSLRWNLMSSSETGLSIWRKKAQKYPSPNTILPIR